MARATTWRAAACTTSACWRETGHCPQSSAASAARTWHRCSPTTERCWRRPRTSSGHDRSPRPQALREPDAADAAQRSRRQRDRGLPRLDRDRGHRTGVRSPSWPGPASRPSARRRERCGATWRWGSRCCSSSSRRHVAGRRSHAATCRGHPATGRLDHRRGPRATGTGPGLGRRGEPARHDDEPDAGAARGEQSPAARLRRRRVARAAEPGGGAPHAARGGARARQQRLAARPPGSLLRDTDEMDGWCTTC